MSFVCLLYFFFTTQIEFSELCLISIIHSMMLLLCLQCRSLLLWREKRKSELLMDVFCVFSFVFTSQIEFSECCVWFQCFTQWCCSYVSNSVVCYCKRKEIVICWWMSFVCLLSSVFTKQIEFCECCVWFQCFIKWCCSSFPNLVACLCEAKGRSEL